MTSLTSFRRPDNSAGAVPETELMDGSGARRKGLIK